MRRVVLVLSLCLGMLVAAGAGGVRAHHSEAAAADIAPLAAVQADSLVDSYGIGIHLGFLDTPSKDAPAVANGCPVLSSPQPAMAGDTWDTFAQGFFASYCTRFRCSQ